MILSSITEIHALDHDKIYINSCLIIFGQHLSHFLLYISDLWKEKKISYIAIKLQHPTHFLILHNIRYKLVFN